MDDLADIDGLRCVAVRVEGNLRGNTAGENRMDAGAILRAADELHRTRALFLSAVSMLETPDAWCTACGRPRHRVPRGNYALGHEDDCPRGAIEREAERIRALK